MKYRHEWKHEITYCDQLVLRQRLKHIMKQDAHGQNGRYFIRSLYLDTPGDTALREKIDGINIREKFRIRYYDLNTSVIHLEKKSKRNGLGTKESANLTAEEAQSIVDGRVEWMKEDSRPLVRELYGKMKTQGLQPKTIVDYTRDAYTFGAGNVRVTLDYDIRTGLRCTDFLNPECVTVPVPDSPRILEVKWDEFLPWVIRDAVQLTGRHTAAFSKYAACRNYD